MQADKSRKILIIEDEEELAFGLAIFLKSRGYSVVIANDSLHGISLSHKEDVDFVILDLGLPAGGGLFVLENLKRSVDTINIPVVIVTASQDQEAQKKAFKLGIEAYLQKPFEPEDILSYIEKAIGKNNPSF